MQKRKTIWFDHIKQMFCLGVISVVLGVLLLTLVFCIPTDSVKRHVYSSADRIFVDLSEESGMSLRRYIMEYREIFTDAIMVQNAFEKIQGKNPYEHAMWVYHLDLDENVWTPEATLKYLSENGDSSIMFLHQYSRYWHGYLVYLKPLLMLFSWEQVLWLGAGLQTILTLVLFVTACRVKHPEVGIAVVIGLLFMKPALMLSSLAMSICWPITLAALFLILLRHDRLEKKEHYPEFFFMIGIVVAYFDFLTYPIVTLGFPLCAFFLMNREEKLKRNVGRTIIYSGCWALGYVSMWASKWILADLTLQSGTIKSAFSSILGWTEAIGGRPRISGGLYVIMLNLQEYKFWIYPVLAGVLVLFDIVAFVRASRRVSIKRAAVCSVPYLLTACLPFVWYIVVQHHSGLHIAFTFRIISVAALALGAAGLSLMRIRKEETAEVED